MRRFLPSADSKDEPRHPPASVPLATVPPPELEVVPPELEPELEAEVVPPELELEPELEAEVVPPELEPELEAEVVPPELEVVTAAPELEAELALDVVTPELEVDVVAPELEADIAAPLLDALCPPSPCVNWDASEPESLSLPPLLPLLHATTIEATARGTKAARHMGLATSIRPPRRRGIHERRAFGPREAWAPARVLVSQGAGRGGPPATGRRARTGPAGPHPSVRDRARRRRRREPAGVRHVPPRAPDGLFARDARGARRTGSRQAPVPSAGAVVPRLRSRRDDDVSAQRRAVARPDARGLLAAVPGGAVSRSARGGRLLRVVARVDRVRGDPRPAAHPCRPAESHRDAHAGVVVAFSRGLAGHHRGAHRLRRPSPGVEPRSRARVPSEGAVRSAAGAGDARDERAPQHAGPPGRWHRARSEQPAHGDRRRSQPGQGHAGRGARRRVAGQRGGQSADKSAAPLGGQGHRAPEARGSLPHAAAGAQGADEAPARDDQRRRRAGGRTARRRRRPRAAATSHPEPRGQRAR